MGRSLIILGLSARAAAESAVRAGFAPWCIDVYGDRDLHRIATVRVCPPREFPSAMLRMLDDAPAEADLLLTAGMENHPDLLDAICFDHPLLGSGVDAIRQVRDPLALPTLPAVKGLRFCKTRQGASLAQRVGAMLFGGWSRRQYLIKPQRSCGGANVRHWTADQPVAHDQYLQQYIRGTPYCAVFKADGWSAQLVGVTEQLVGEREFGSSGFKYTGSIGPVPMSENARAALSHLAVQLTQKFDVRGAFGVDLVMDWHGDLWPIEVNPRYVDSIELLERALDLSVLAEHDADGKKRTRQPRRMQAKALLRARRDVTSVDLYELFPRDRIADVPAAGRVIRAGRPICSVFAQGPTRDACFDALRQMAQQVYDRLETN